MIERYIRFIVQHPRVVVAAVLIATAVLATQVRHLHLEIRRRANLPDAHPYVQIQNRISDLFGGEAIVIIGVIARRGDIFGLEMLGKVHRITDGLLGIPGIIEPSVFSLAAPYVRAVVPREDGVMDIRPLMEGAPTTLDDALRTRRLVEEDRLFRDNLISSDATAAVIVADFDDRVTDVKLIGRIQDIIAAEQDESVQIALAGAPVLRAALSRYTAMIVVLFPLAVLVIGVVHYEAFRTLQAMLLPLVTALLSVVWALGIMGWSGEPMDTWSALTPVLILAVAAGHAVQILKRYYEEVVRVGDNREAVVRSITAVAPVMLTAGCIAAAGFASLMTFGITSVRVFGQLLASGIASALVIELTFTPACRCLLPLPKRREVEREKASHRLDRLLDHLAGTVVRRPYTVLALAVGVGCLSALGMAAIDVDNSFRFWFAPNTRVRQDDAVLNEKLAGTATLRILIEGTAPDAMKDPAVLRAIDDLERFLDADPNIGGVTSIADHVKRMHQAMHDGDASYFAIPDNPRLIGEYLLLYSMAAGPDGLSAFVDADYQRAVIRALSKTDTAAFSRDLLTRATVFAATRFQGLPVDVGIAGGTLGVQTAMNDMVVHEKIQNMLQVSAIIFCLCALALRSVVGALYVLLPLAVAVMVNFGVMGWTRTWLDMTTATITAMGVSVGADFAIYLIFRIREEWRARGSLEAAIRTSLRTSGKAIFFVSSAVALGYLVLPLSGFSIWTRLGVLTALIVSVSALATLTVIPALALVMRPRFLMPVGSPATLDAAALRVRAAGGQ